MNILNEKRRLLPLSGYMLGGGGGGSSGGSSSSAPTQTTSTITNSNIPTYAEPYVESMLGATQKQLFNTSTNALGNTSLDSFKPYQAYGGTYAKAGDIVKDAQGNPVMQQFGGGMFGIPGFSIPQTYQGGEQLSYDPGKAVAGFQPMQQAAQQGIANLQVPGQMGLASDATTNAMMRAANMGYGGQQFGNQYQGIMGYNPGQYNQQSINAPSLQNYQMQGPQDVSGAQTRAAQAGAAPTANAQNMQAYDIGAAPTATAQNATAQNMQAYDIGAAPTATAQNATAQNMQAYNMGAAPTNQAAQFQGPGDIGYQGVSNQGLTNYQMQGPNNIGYQGVSNQGLTNYQMGGPQQVGTQQFTGDQVGQYMNPYLKQSLDPQLQEIQRQYGITGANQQSAATQAGAFGGSREAIMAAENERNKNTAMNNTISQGYNNAFQNAQQQFNAQQAANLQAQQANQQAGLTTGQANLNAALGIQSLGAGQNMQAQLANQQAGLTAAQANQQAGLTTGQANLNAALGIQSLGAGQNMQAQLANQQAGLTAGQFNATNAYNTAAQNAQLAQQANLANQSLQGQFGLQQGQFGQQANAANQAAQNQFGLTNQAAQNQFSLANQALQGQYGLQQGQFGQQTNAANQAAQNQFGLTNQAAQNQFSLANQALQGQYGLQQGQFGQQANASNQAAQNQFGLANQAMQGQYGLANLSNQQQANLQNAQMRQQANLANQQAGLTTGQANLNANLGIQSLGAQQNLAAQQANQQTNLATQQAQQQANQFGYGQAANQAQLAAQYGLSANQLNAQQQQFGAQYGMNALQAQLAAANQLSGQGQAQLAAQQGIYGLQNQAGAQQQALEQAKINQAMTDYANAQQYPLMQLGTMSNMLRGLPMQASTTNQYAAAPSALSQGIGAAGAYAGLAQAGVIPKAKGGAIKSMAAGGITSIPRYDVGGEVYSDLIKMSPDELKEQAKSSSSNMVKQMAQSLLKQQRPPSMAGGGIIAFAKGSPGEYQGPEGNAGEEEAQTGMQERLAQPPAGGGIMGAAPALAPAQPPMSPDALVNVQRQMAEHNAIANKSLEETMAERQKMKEAMGVGSNQPAEDYRAKIMSERANSEDEAKRQKGMRLAEFFASWGSTPGPLLVAGMSALRKSIPGMIDDEKARKKADRESDKIIYDIDQATRLEKLGRIDEATAIKDKAAKAAQDLNHFILQYQASIEGHKLTKEGQIESAKIHKEASLGSAQTHKEATLGAAAATDERNGKKLDEATRAHMAAEAFKADQAVRATEAQIKKEKAADNNYRTQSMIASQTRTPAKERAAANAAVAAADADWDRRIADAQEAAKFAKAQLNEVNTRLGYGGKKADNETTPPPAPTPTVDPSKFTGQQAQAYQWAMDPANAKSPDRAAILKKLGIGQ